MQTIAQPRLYTLPFLLLCASHALFGSSFTMIIPELPGYLTSLGGAEYKGLIIALFTLTAGLSRPFSGVLADTVGRTPVMIIGTLVCVVCSLFYPILSSVSGFLILRFFHGFSTGFKPTASTAYVADIVPAHRRGEAMGIMGVSMNAGSSISPPLGSWLAQTYSLDVLFYVSSGLAVLSIIILLNLKETLAERQPFRMGLLAVHPRDVIEPTALAPAIVCLLVYFSYGTLLTIVPDQSEFLGIANKGLFFTTFTICSVGSRLVAGKLSDRFGRVPVMKVAGIFTAASLVWMGLAHTPFMLLAAAGALGFGTGIGAPAVFAWVIDRCPDNRRGRGMATVYIALEVGIGSGALVSAWVYANNPANFGLAFFITAVVALAGTGYLQLRKP